MKNVAKIFRIAGLKIGLICLFILTFRFYSGSYRGFNLMAESTFSSAIGIGLSGFAIFTLLLVCANLFFNFSKQKNNVIESVVGLSLIALVLLFFYFPLPYLYLVLFIAAFIVVVSLLVYIGYLKEDMLLVNMGLGWAALFMIVKYFDYFGGLLPRSISFIVGGLIFVMGGIALEKKRRQLKLKFAKHSPVN